MKSYQIIHIPCYRDGYQESLLKNLRNIGLDAKYGKIPRIFSFVNCSVLYNVIINFKMDVLHLHWQHQFLLGNTKFKTMCKSFLFICQLLLIKLLGIKIVWTVHNLVDHEKRFQREELLFCRIIAGLTDKIIAHCNTAKRNIKTKFSVKENNKIVVIPHGAFFGYYKNTFSRDEARNRLNLSQKDLIFLYLGQIRPYKGVVELIEAFQDLNPINTKLIVAGRVRDRQLADVIRKKGEVNSNIQMVLQSIPNDKMQIYMNAADIFVLPYRDVLTSGGIISGMTFGKAIIAPFMGCIPEILNSSGGFLYDPENENGLLNAMKKATNISIAMIEKMGKYNCHQAKKLEWAKIAVSTYRVYEGCIRRAL